jgi:hypothetical protein
VEQVLCQFPFQPSKPLRAWIRTDLDNKTIDNFGKYDIKAVISKSNPYYITETTCKNLCPFCLISGAKCVYEATVTPVTYDVVNFLKRHEGLDVYDYDTQFSPLLIGG